MNRIAVVTVAAVLVVGAIAVYQFSATNGKEQSPTEAVVPNAAQVVAPIPTKTVAVAVATPAPAPEPVTPTPIPAPIAKELAQVRAHAPSRPMTQLAKSWFGCASMEAYNTTLALIRDKSPTSSEHFKGAQADCAPLATGTHITVMRIDEATGMAQISIDESHQVIWTDSMALAGDPNQK